jgi:hypothetical protein
MLLGSSLVTRPAQAGYVVTLAQRGSNVVAAGSGTIDLAGLTLSNTGVSVVSAIIPNARVTNTGPVTGVLEDVYTRFIGPTKFGSGILTFADLGSGDGVGVNGSVDNLFLPMGYG